MVKNEFSPKPTFIVHTRRQILRSFTKSLIQNLQVLHIRWHKQIFIKVSHIGFTIY